MNLIKHTIPTMILILFITSSLLCQTNSVLSENNVKDSQGDKYVCISKEIYTKRTSENKKMIEIRGIYGSPVDFWEKGYDLAHLGVNAIFVRSRSINNEMIKRARAEGLQIFAEFATLNGTRYVENHPEAWPIDEQGKKVEPASWFMGICPTDSGFKHHKINELRDLLKKFDLDGIWMDYLHWHAQFEEPVPILPETCFCASCLSIFQASTGVALPEGNTSKKATWILNNHDSKWREWRCSVIAGWVQEFKKIIKEVKPNAILGIFHCPWEDNEFDQARRRYLGIDYDMLRQDVDVFSPLVYHARMGRNVDWVEQNVTWLCQRLNIKVNTFPKIWPIVQSYNDPYVISADEFETVLRYGISAQATGVMMFTSASTAEDEQKTEKMKQVYREWLEED